MVGRKRTSRKKKGSGAAGFLLTVFLLALLAAGAGAWLVLAPFGPSTETFVEVAPGSSTARIGQQLEASGVVRSHFAFDCAALLEARERCAPASTGSIIRPRP
jgi:cell division protein YceG involved in septum cleavage